METMIQIIIDQIKSMEWNLETDPQEVARISKAIQYATEESGYSKVMKEVIATLYSDPEYNGPYFEIGKNITKEQDNESTLCNRNH